LNPTDYPVGFLALIQPILANILDGEEDDITNQITGQELPRNGLYDLLG